MANGFNPLASFQQGQKFRQGQQARAQQQNITDLQNSLAGQINQPGFSPSSSPEFQSLSVLAPDIAAKTLSTFQTLDKPRQQAFFQDARTGLDLLEKGDFRGFEEFASNRLENVNRLGGDPSDVADILQTFASGDVDGTINKLANVEQIGIDQGFLKSQVPEVRVQSSKILDDGTIIEVLKGGGRQVISPTGEILTGTAARDSVAASSKKVQDRKIELKRLDQTIKRAQAKEGVVTAEQKLIQSGNIRRLGELSGTSSGRSSAVKKAVKFKNALEKGEAFSGAGRKAAQFIPGVFTSQGQFDEEFNAFSEVAARQQLKAAGEIRPTDADVKGMKEAMFGLGRDEAVNVQLLTDFIDDQNAQNEELDQLIDASKGGSLSTFTFTPQGTVTQQAPAVNIQAIAPTRVGRFTVEVQE